MATVQDLVGDALREIGVLAAGETLSAEDGTTGLATLNRMIDAWKAERVYLYGLTRSTWAIVASDGSYTVGTGGDVNTARPTRIDAVNYIDTSITPNHEVPLRLMTDQDWEQIRIRTQESLYPEAVWYDLSYPLATLNLWPVPTSATLTGVLYAPTIVSVFAATSDSVSFPPGYERMIVKNLALELAPQYGATPGPGLEKQAQESQAVVLRSNKRLQEIRFPPDAAMNRQSYDIYTDHP